MGSNPVVCTAIDQCHVAGTCDSATGTCSNPAAPDGTSCSDGNGCTPNDACHSGICIGAGSLNCDDGDVCTTDSCDPTTGGCRHDQIAGCGGATFGISVIDPQGLPIAGAQVTVGSATQLTDAAGTVLFTDVPPGRTVAAVRAAGFASSTVVADLVANITVEATDRLLSQGRGITFDAGSGVVGSNDGVRVSIPPDAVVDANGQPVAGNVQLMIVPLDPSTSKVDFAPGPFTGQPAAGGGLITFESLFMAELSLQDGNGNPLQLAPTATAEVAFRVPSNLVSKVSVGDQVPAWFYDASAGLWREEGVGTIQVTGSNIEWVATVGHLSWWSADRPWADTNCVRVTVTQTDGTPIAGATVRATGLSYSGTTTSETGADGSACLELERGALVMITVEHPSFPVHLDDPFILQGDPGTAATCSDLPNACQQIVLKLGGQTCFRGTVVDPSGRLMAGAQVYASFNDASGNLASYAAQTGDDGSFCVDAPSNSCIEVFAFAMDSVGPLRAQSRGCGSAASEPICGPGVQCSDLGILQLARAATHACVKGHVVTPQGAAGGTAVSVYSDQPQVTCSNPPAPTDDPGYWGSLVAQGTTAADGSFCVDIPVAPTNSDPSPFSLPRAVLPAACEIRRSNSNNRGAVTLYLDPFALDRTCAASPDCFDIGEYDVFFLGGS